MHTTHDTAPLAGALLLGILAVGLGGLALGVQWAWVAFPVGYGGALPLALGVAKRRREREPTTDDDPLATLRDRYARGEIDEREFEARVEGLLETER